MRAPAGSAQPSRNVELEVLEDKTYNPPWLISDADPQWNVMSWDKERDERCKTLLRPELGDAPQLQTWQLFVNDPSGRRKVRYTGPAICDSDALWFLDYAIEPARTTLAKYRVDGTLAYRVSFPKPFDGGIRLPSLNSQDGYVQLEWWSVQHGRVDHEVKRLMRARFKEPDLAAPAPAGSPSTRGHENGS